MSDWAIDVKNLTKKFDDNVAVNHLSLQVQKGSIFGFLGSNGSGKTTTIRMLCGLLTPTDGSGVCLGYDILTQSDAIKMRTGYMPQQFSFYNGLTVKQNLRFAADIFQISNPTHRIAEIINDMQFKRYKNVRAGNLSGGWKNRLALACCLLHKPQLLFLDEPTAGVDPKARKEFWDQLHKIAEEYGTTTLVATHYMDEAEKCTHLAYINLGTLLFAGETKKLIPESHIKTYKCTGDKERLVTDIAKNFHRVGTFIVSNELRISSADEEALNKVISRHSEVSFHAVTPSFEEVFIGLIP